ncbi:MAG: molecular chaperone TorD family protein [Candidatus Rokubacteria bacterium]|nr:molecular chaperone TorD family protein [Candidatus Rokubacteria bacterium]
MSRAEEAIERASIYELLALGFSLPSPELAKAVSGLISEYHRLFVGPGELPAPPYESVYREGWRVMGETTLDVQSAYEEAGYALDPSFKELPDHVAAELAFMGLLTEEEAKAWKAGDASVALSWLERERAFLDDHLTRWLPAFCDRLLASTEVRFYRKLAGELQEFVALDAERVTALTGLLEEALA